MLSSIHPLGERTRNNQWPLTVAYYLIGGLLGGVTIGALAGAVGWLGLQWWAPTPASSAAATAAVLITALVWDVSGFTIPTIHRQVNEDWLRMYRSWVYGGGFGFQLGLGVVTIVTTAATYAMVGLAGLAASPVSGAIIGGVFGLVRALPILTVGRIGSGEALRTYHRTMQALAPRADWLVRFAIVTAGFFVAGGLL
jgi:hypothetical protein